MRAYFLPLIAGVALVGSAFLPWVVIGEISLRGIPEVPALWVMGLGALAAVLALLSLITRKNSRHPLLVVGLVSLGIMFLSWRIMPEAVGRRALVRSQAIAIVQHTQVQDPPPAFTGSGIYVGLVASSLIVAFGLTIVVRKVSSPYAIKVADDDVE